MIPQFLPEAILSLTQDAEGDATVFDLNGSINMTRIRDEKDAEGADERTIFYEIREKSWFDGVAMAETPAKPEAGYHENGAEDSTNKVTVNAETGEKTVAAKG